MSELCVNLQWQRRGFALNVEFDAPAQGITALFGASGCGKTTLLRCIAGLDRADSGNVSLQGICWQNSARNIFVPTDRRRLGYVFQDAALLDHLTVAGNLAYGYRRTPVAERSVTLDQAVDWTGIGHLLTRRTHGLSGGERSRVAMARALATSPRLLLMDEPLAALDMQAKAEILPYLERLHRELSVPVLYVSHALDEVARLADHLVYLEQGRSLAAGDMSAMLTRIDLPLSHSDEASAVIEARVVSRDAEYQLATLEFNGQALRMPDAGLAVGAPARVRILARDVSLSCTLHENTSILNIFPVTLVSLHADRPAQVLVGLEAAGVPLLARLTRKSWHELGFAVGQRVYAQVKSVALLG